MKKLYKKNQQKVTRYLLLPTTLNLINQMELYAHHSEDLKGNLINQMELYAHHTEDLKGYKKISKTRILISQLKLTRSNKDRGFAAF